MFILSPLDFPPFSILHRIPCFNDSNMSCAYVHNAIHWTMKKGIRNIAISIENMKEDKMDRSSKFLKRNDEKFIFNGIYFMLKRWTPKRRRKKLLSLWEQTHLIEFKVHESVIFEICWCWYDVDIVKRSSFHFWMQQSVIREIGAYRDWRLDGNGHARVQEIISRKTCEGFFFICKLLL